MLEAWVPGLLDIFFPPSLSLTPTASPVLVCFTRFPPVESPLALTPVLPSPLGTVTQWLLSSIDCLLLGISNSLAGHGTHLPVLHRVLCNEKYCSTLQGGVWHGLPARVPEAALCHIISLNSVFLAVSDVTELSLMHTLVKSFKFIKNECNDKTNR